MKRHLNQEQRCQISGFLKSNLSIRAIAKEMKISPSTISREIKRNGGYCRYEPFKAQTKATKRRQKIPRKKICKSIWKVVLEKLFLKWSPEQISGYLKKEDVFISHETIYKYIWKNKENGGNWCIHLRNQGKRNQKRGSKNAGRGIIPNRKGIEKRPKEAEKKDTFGHLEIDLVVGKGHQGMLITIVDRYSKHLWTRLISSKHAKNVSDKVIELFEKNKETNLIKTITSDNGKEFAQHELITEKTGIDCYFANPYCSWERGLNEHTNRLLRQYFPKKMDFGILTQEVVDQVTAQINNRPRKVLNYTSPQQIIDQIGILKPTVAFQS